MGVSSLKRSDYSALKVWKGCKLRIYVIAQAEDERSGDEMKVRLQKHIYMLRIDATVFVRGMIEIF